MILKVSMSKARKCNLLYIRTNCTTNFYTSGFSASYVYKKYLILSNQNTLFELLIIYLNKPMSIAITSQTHSREESILETEHSTVENDTSTYDKKAYVTCSEYHKTEAENDSKSVLSPSKPANKFPDVISKCSERQESPVEKIEKSACIHFNVS